jgi:tetratricopeptide (TPR) repeat protein
MDNPLTSQVYQKRKKNGTIIPKALSCEVLVLSDMSPAQTVDINVSSGILSFNRKEFDVALNRLNRSILQHRKAFLPRFIRGLCHYHLMNWNDAKKDFEVCCKSNEAKKRDDFDQALAFYNRSVVWMKLQDSKRAMDDLNTAISMFSFEKTFYKNRALLLRRFGDFQSAQNDYKLIRRFEAEEKRNDSPGGLDFKSRMNMGSIKQISRTSSIRPVCFGRDGRRKTIIMKRPGSKQSQMRDELRTSIFGQVHFALTCESSKRTNAQIDLLVNESRMMAAFAQLNVDQISALWKYLEYRKYPSNVRIFEQGDIAQDYFLIWSGSVSCRVANQKSILKHTNISRALAMEREFIVNTITAGETLGEAIISEDATRKAACVTEEPSEMLVLNRKNFDKTFEIFVEKSMDEKRSFLSDFDFFSSWSSEFSLRHHSYRHLSLLYHLLLKQMRKWKTWFTLQDRRHFIWEKKSFNRSDNM